MIRYLFLLIALASFGCKTESRESQNDLDTQAIAADSTEVLAWSPEDEMLGLGKIEFGGLDSMIQRRYIRALVPYTKTYYYINGKERRGLAFEGLNLFEKYLNQQLNFYPPKVRIIFIPVSHDQLIPLLEAGYADIAFGGITITDDRQQQVDFSTPTLKGLKEIIVGGPSAPPLSTLGNLSDQHVFVHANSSYLLSLHSLNDSLQHAGLRPVNIEIIDQYLSPEDILEMVSTGLIPFTVAEDDIANYWSTLLDGLTLYPELAVRKDAAYACALRKGTPKLKEVINQFLATNGKGTTIGNVLFNRYLKPRKTLHNAQSPASMERLKQTEAIFRKYADQYQLDWLLLAAQGYQESQLNNDLVSHTGAVGIMQVMPSTAAHDPVNIPDVHKLENNVHAAAKYMRYLMDHYFGNEAMDPLNKQLFALASYNAGPSRIANLRKTAKAQQLNTNVWFDNVEKVVAQDIGRETIQYVSNIYKYYTSYAALRVYSKQSGKTLI